MSKNVHSHTDTMVLVLFFLLLSIYRIRHPLKLRARAQQRQIHLRNWVHFVECWMLSGTALRNVAAQKSRIGYWTSNRTALDRKAYRRRMCHQMHQQPIYYAVTCPWIRPYHHIIGWLNQIKHSQEYELNRHSNKIMLIRLISSAFFVVVPIAMLMNRLSKTIHTWIVYICIVVHLLAANCVWHEHFVSFEYGNVSNLFFRLWSRVVTHRPVFFYWFVFNIFSILSIFSAFTSSYFF